MPQPGDDLFQLINSLSSNEKRYFKLFAQQHGADKAKVYMKIFDLIASQGNTYNEEQVKNKLGSPKDVKMFAQLKVYLYDLVMKSMRVYRSEKNASSEVFDLIQDELFYTEKGLTDMRLKAMKRAKELAYKYDLTYLIVALLQRERIYAMKFSGGDPMMHINRIHQEEQAVFESLNNESELGKIFYTLWAQYIIDPKLQDEAVLQEYIAYKNHPLLSDIKQIKTFFGKFSFIKARNHIKRFEGDYQGLYTISKQLVALFDEYPQHRFNVMGNYIDALAGMLAAAHNIGDYSEYDNLLGKLHQLPKDKLKDEAAIEIMALHYKILYYMNTGKFDRCDEVIAEFDNVCLKFPTQMHQSNFIGNLYNIALFLFIQHRITDALSCTQRIINLKTDAKQDIIHGAIMLEFILHFELQNNVFLDSAIRNGTRNMQNKNRFLEFEKSFTSYMRKLNKTPKNEQIEVFKEMFEFYKGMNAVNKKRRLVLIEETLAWTSSKVSGRPISETIYDKY